MRTSAALLSLLFCCVFSGAGGQDIIPVEGMLAAHNQYRAYFKTPPLVWSQALAMQAQQWARRLIARYAFSPNRSSHFGQNLFEISHGSATADQVVAAWMSEEKNYHHSTNTCSARCGHFTQVVWRDTKSVGCAVARNVSREVWVCAYDPPGNIIGERPY